MNDNSKMPYGKYIGQPLISVPGDYLIWLYDNKKVSGELKTYIEQNIDVLRTEIKRKK